MKIDNTNPDEVIEKLLNIEADLILRKNLSDHLNYVTDSLKNISIAIENGKISGEPTIVRERIRKHFLNLYIRIFVLRA